MVAKPGLVGAQWWMLLVTAALFVLVAVFVDLKPVVDENFFFSSSDPGFRQTKKIEKRFPSQTEVIFAVSSRDISSPRYLGRIQKLTRRLREIEAITTVKSLADGPKNFADAAASPFWSRLLLAEDRKSSNVIAFMENTDPEKTIKDFERIVHELDEPDFRIHIAGPPYVVEMIRRSLAHDFWYFSLTAVVLFGITMAVMFRSVRVFVGMLVTCASALLLTLLLQSFLGGRIGVLTVNLGTIVFVVALSHLVYMTFNWQTLARREGKESGNLAAAAVRMTFPPSFWSIICAGLGFGSLLLVEAKPLRELGFGGVLGSVVAFACAYLIYPPFLRWAVPHKTKIVHDRLAPRQTSCRRGERAARDRSQTWIQPGPGRWHLLFAGAARAAGRLEPGDRFVLAERFVRRDRVAGGAVDPRDRGDDCKPHPRAPLHAGRHRLAACADGRHLRARHQCLRRYRDRFDDPPRLRRAPRPA